MLLYMRGLVYNVCVCDLCAFLRDCDVYASDIYVLCGCDISYVCVCVICSYIFLKLLFNESFIRIL